MYKKKQKNNNNNNNNNKKKKKSDSPAGNRTRVFRVTGGDTYHYTTEDIRFGHSKFGPLLLIHA